MNRHYVESMYRLGYIKRYSTHMINHVQNVSVHTFNVMGLCIETYFKENLKMDLTQLLLKAYFHDFGEAVLGDIPSPTRNYNDTIHEEIKRIEELMLVPVLKDDKMDLTEFARDAKKGPEGELVKLADIVERLLYILQEKKSGNHTLDDVYDNTITQLKSEPYRSLLKKFTTIKAKVKHYAAEWTEE